MSWNTKNVVSKTVFYNLSLVTIEMSPIMSTKAFDDFKGSLTNIKHLTITGGFDSIVSC